MQYSQEHLKTMVYAEFGGQTECIMGNWKIENGDGKQDQCFEFQS